MRELQSDVLNLKKDIDDMNHKLSLIIRELKLTAGKDELKTLTKYLDLWNPARFATRDEVVKMIGEHIQHKH